MRGFPRVQALRGWGENPHCGRESKARGPGERKSRKFLLRRVAKWSRSVKGEHLTVEMWEGQTHPLGGGEGERARNFKTDQGPLKKKTGERRKAAGGGNKGLKGKNKKNPNPSEGFVSISGPNTQGRGENRAIVAREGN